MHVGFATLCHIGLSKPGLDYAPGVIHKNQAYLDFEEQFDADESVLGIGAVKAGGLLLTAHKVF